MAVKNFKKNKYKIIKDAVPKDIATFVYNYFLLKRQVLTTFQSNKYISPFTQDWGTFEDPQAPNSYSHYSDVATETLLLFAQSFIEKETGLNLLPNYSYARIYKDGDVLERHKDRFSCEVSCTLHLGGDTSWPIYLEPSGKRDKKGTAVIQKPGDILIYMGGEMEHWREAYTGKDYCQAFLHYNNANTPQSADNIYDSRPHLGLPANFKKAGR
tara:strand:- start:974 stop:1612 length:639 start_codon:yes stop_codon:yes gene_type:complete